VTSTIGMLRRATNRQLVIEADDHRIVWYRVGDQIEVRKDGKEADLQSFAPGDRLDVSSTSDDRGHYTATAVRWRSAGTPQDKAAAERTWDLPNETPPARERAGAPPERRDDDRPVLRRREPRPAEPAQAKAEPPESREKPPDPPNEELADARPATTVRPANPRPDQDDPGRPVLRRGAPKRESSEPRSSSVPRNTSTGESSNGPLILTKDAAGTPAATNSRDPAPAEDDVLAKMRAAAATYFGSLPNYLCRMITTRYESEGARRSWRALDIVTADLAYEDGQESYKNIKIGNKSANLSIDSLDGMVSIGEFATMLREVLDPATRAEFRRRTQDTIGGRAAWLYRFEVSRDLSRWRIESPSQLYYAAYTGSVWVDQQTFRVLRVEQQARNLPPLFPFDTAEAAADYDFLRIETTGPYLLPVKAQVLMCQRGAGYCMRNDLEFHNYRKFGAESGISFENPARTDPAPASGGPEPGGRPAEAPAEAQPARGGERR
jgi:hypothetical protein